MEFETVLGAMRYRSFIHDLGPNYARRPLVYPCGMWTAMISVHRADAAR